MKDSIHPDYHATVFKDDSTGYSFITRSTMSSDDKVKWEDGNEYPLIKLDISSSSHPFYTGQHRLVDTAGRVERFRRRYGREPAGKDATNEVTSSDATGAESVDATDTASEG